MALIDKVRRANTAIAWEKLKLRDVVDLDLGPDNGGVVLGTISTLCVSVEEEENFLRAILEGGGQVEVMDIRMVLRIRASAGVGA